jgi:phosphoglycolate phosphatase
LKIKLIKTPPKAILFDWDNTLVNNWEPIFFAYKETLKKLGLRNQSKDETLKNAKYSLRETFPKIFKDDWIKAKRIFYNNFKKIHLKKIKPIRNAERLLKTINKKKIISGVISNKDGNLLRKEIKKLGWGKYFKVIVGANEAKKDKPSKYPLLLALNKISLKSNKDIWYVGDNEIDVEFAKKNNCLSIFIENKLFKKKDLKRKPNLILKKIETLELYIK